MHADEKMRMVTKLIFGEIKECWGKFLPLSGIPPADAAKLLALSLIVGENRGWGGVCRRRVRDSSSLFWALHHHASGNSMHAD